jgi:hypothetical protein
MLALKSSRHATVCLGIMMIVLTMIAGPGCAICQVQAAKIMGHARTEDLLRTGAHDKPSAGVQIVTPDSKKNEVQKALDGTPEQTDIEFQKHDGAASNEVNNAGVEAMAKHHILSVNSNLMKHVRDEDPDGSDVQIAQQQAEIEHAEARDRAMSSEEYRKHTREESVKAKQLELARQRRADEEMATERELIGASQGRMKGAAEQASKRAKKLQAQDNEDARKAQKQLNRLSKRERKIKAEARRKRAKWRKRVKSKANKAGRHEKEMRTKQAKRDKALSRLLKAEKLKQMAAEKALRRAIKKRRAIEQKQKHKLERREKAREARIRQAEQRVKNERKAKRQKRIEQQRKRDHEQSAKRKREQAGKAERRAKAHARRTQKGKWCDCMHMRLGHRFIRGGSWFTCPGGRLMTGLHRNHIDMLHGITHFSCCRPCRGGTRMGLRRCRHANWWHKFDRAGTVRCPGNTYMRGIYKNHCQSLFCIEHAQCCEIAGSRGRQHCNYSNRWWGTLDRPGWSMVDGNRFMAGLHRTGGNRLHNLESSLQCTFWAY